MRSLQSRSADRYLNSICPICSPIPRSESRGIIMSPYVSSRTVAVSLCVAMTIFSLDNLGAIPRSGPCEVTVPPAFFGTIRCTGPDQDNNCQCTGGHRLVHSQSDCQDAMPYIYCESFGSPLVTNWGNINPAGITGGMCTNPLTAVDPLCLYVPCCLPNTSCKVNLLAPIVSPGGVTCSLTE